MSSRLQIFDAIVNKLTSLDDFKGSDGTIRVYEHAIDTPDGYPACSVLRGSRDEDSLTNVQHQNEYNYIVRVYMDVHAENKGRKQSERILIELEDTIFDLFNQDLDLGVAGLLEILPKSASDSDYLDPKTKFFDITLTALTIKQVSL